MMKRIISGVLLACIIVPTFFWAKDMIAVSVKPNSVATKFYDAAYAAKAKLLELTADGKRAAVHSEIDQIAFDIEETESLLAQLELSAGNETQVEALRSDLAELLRRRERALSGSQDQLLALDAERLEAEKYFLVKLRSRAAKEEWNSLVKIARIEASMTGTANRHQQEQAATIVNDFIDAVVMLDVEAAREMSAPSLASEISLARMRSMRRNTPSELEDGFELRHAGAADSLEVWAGEHLATISSRDGSWLFESAWK